MQAPLRHLIDIKDLSVSEIGALLSRADGILARPGDYADACHRKKLATLFYEPSTRTRLSFEAAMLELGGAVLGFSSQDSSSASKGESVADTIRVVSGYADVIAMRHPKEGAPIVAARHANVPVINAGDGGHNHPTQTLTDLLTIQQSFGRLSKLTVGLCGDLKFGRTVHSLISAMVRYPDVRFVLISPPELKCPDYVMAQIQRSGVAWEESRQMEEVMDQLDILYMTRVQRERFFNEADYVRLKDSFILDVPKLARAKPEMIVMHPLPRVNEIQAKVDENPHARYFEQAVFGKYVRMALILFLLGLEKEGEAA
ncbi:MAG: aspartate carbamoyltransferase [Oscillospiraceae bacterium]|jgi:aspartate carbamoyltransferase catalytic subunit|nr:aspartate carbamoyltransferase [Oscillospiraceae bacterium]